MKSPPKPKRPALQHAEVWKRYLDSGKTDLQARNELVESALRVVSLAVGRIYRRLPRWSGTDFSDLVSAGTFGLIRAVERFEPDRGVCLEAFASRHVYGAILDYLRVVDTAPRLNRIKRNEYERKLAELEQEIGRRPNPEEAAAAIGVEPACPAGVQASAVMARIPGFGGRNPNKEPRIDEMAIGKRLRHEGISLLEELARGLPKKSRAVLILYTIAGWRMKDVGVALGLCESRVSQLHDMAVREIKTRWPGGIRQVREALDVD